MDDTTFTNASGLHNHRQVTTAYDMYRLGLALQDRFPMLYRFFGKPSFRYGSRTISGHNPFLGTWRGVDGIKTGYTRASGYNLVTNLTRDGKHIVAVVVGAHTSAERNKRMGEVLGMATARASDGPRLLARLDDPVSVGRTLVASAPERSLRPAQRVGNKVAVALPLERRPPPDKPSFLADNEILFVADAKTLGIMKEDLAEPKSDLRISTKNGPTHLAFDVTPRARVASFAAQMQGSFPASNVTVAQASFAPAECLAGGSCFLRGVQRVENGHFKVRDPSTFAMISESMMADHLQ